MRSFLSSARFLFSKVERRRWKSMVGREKFSGSKQIDNFYKSAWKMKWKKVEMSLFYQLFEIAPFTFTYLCVKELKFVKMSVIAFNMQTFYILYRAGAKKVSKTNSLCVCEKDLKICNFIHSCIRLTCSAFLSKQSEGSVPLR